jgi:acyl carrier protein
MTQTSTSHRVREVIVDVLELDMSAAELRESEPLYSALIRLDSLTLLQLITELEAVFGCQIDDEAVMLAELVDVASLVSLVDAQLADGLGRGGMGALTS